MTNNKTANVYKTKENPIHRPLVADFDNDGFRDIIITNRFAKEVTDRDFIDYPFM